MLNFITEKETLKQGYTLIGGIDEAGRGPLAGPVVAACVLCDKNDNLDLLKNSELKNVKDSKKLTEKKREKLCEEINNSFLQIGIGICNNRTIDRINILQASFLAMKKAINALEQKPKYVLVDGKFKIPNLSIPQKAIIRGDGSVFLIACASIIAKVARDHIMYAMHKKYPQYEFAQHKGYGTKKHISNLTKFGYCNIHRKSFAPIKRLLPNT